VGCEFVPSCGGSECGSGSGSGTVTGCALVSEEARTKTRTGKRISFWGIVLCLGICLFVVMRNAEECEEWRAEERVAANKGQV
jgi:hypothetical protein